MSTLTFPGDKPYPQEKYVTTLGVASSVIPDATDEPIKTTNDSEAQQAAKPAQLSLDTTAEQHGQHPLAQLGNARKNFLLGIFAVAYFVDVCNVSGVGIAVAQIGKDTGLSTSQFVWVSRVQASLG